MASPIWNTPQGTIGAFVSNSAVSLQLSASPVAPSTFISYQLIVGKLPTGLSLDSTGLISGTTPSVSSTETTSFVVRATDENGNVRDRTFSITITGIDTPTFVTPAGELFRFPDSTWVEYKVEYTSPDPNATVGIIQGQLPPGLEINETGLIRGYAQPPVVNFNLGPIENAVITISDNLLIGYSTSGYRTGRPIVFSGSLFGGVVAEKTYYVKDVINSTTFTISETVDGPIVELEDSSGYMIANLSAVTLGQPTVQSYTFSLLLLTEGADNIVRTFSITIVNQNAPVAIGGLGKPFNTRVPTILNTRPKTYNIESDPLNFRYYLLPDDSGKTYTFTQEAELQQTISDNQFSFKVLGVDFDNNELEYQFFDLPLGLQGDTVTGWITGNPVISPNTINRYVFSARAYKKNNPLISTPAVTFALVVRNNLTSDITWNTDSNLGTVINGTTSTLEIRATSPVTLRYFLTQGSLPPNLTLTETGDIVGIVSFQPSEELSEPNSLKTYTFTVRAYSPEYSIISSEKTFTVNVRQLFPFPTDTVYATCTPDIETRRLISSLLEDSSLIPTEFLYRPTDPNFGKSTKVVYAHLYGVLASGFEQYIDAVNRNHYRKRITLGELKTAVARNQETNEIIYEVVYSRVIDDLVNTNNVSVNKTINWPRDIEIADTDFITSSIDILTSFSEYQGQDLFTSLTPTNIDTVYPNSLENMRVQVKDMLGAVNNTNLLPLWMITQQEDGSTLGYIPAWVICYTKPGFSEIVRNNIMTRWKDEIGRIKKLNQVDFVIDRFSVGKLNSFNYDNNLVPAAWTSLPGGSPVPEARDRDDFYVIFPQTTILPTTGETN